MKILFLFFFSLASFNLFASAAEDLSVYDQAMRERNKIGVANVKVKDNVIYADFRTKVDKGGSVANVDQKIKVPTTVAQNAKYLANITKSLAKGTAVSAGLTLAIDGILKGVDYVMDPANNTVYKVTPSSNAYRAFTGETVAYGSTPELACRALFKLTGVTFGSVSGERCINSFSNQRGTVRKNENSDPPKKEEVSEDRLYDAYEGWLTSNPSSITDPVVTQIYAPYDPLGKGINGFPSFPSTDYTPEIINNMLEHRNAELEAEKKRLQDPQNSPEADPNTRPEISNPNKTETKTNPDEDPQKETIKLPDGSIKEIERKVVVDPDTGKKKEIITTTITDPNGNKSVQVSEKDYKSPPPETTDLPVVCEYFAFLCAWSDKYKEVSDAEAKHREKELSLWEKITDFFNSDPDPQQDNEIEIDNPDVNESVSVNFGGHQCPSLYHRIAWLNVELNFSPTYLCDLASKLYYFFISLGGYIASRIISRSGS